MTDVLHIHGRDQKGKPNYTKETLGGGDACETITLTADQLPTVDLKAIEAEIAAALWNSPPPYEPPYTAPDKDVS